MSPKLRKSIINAIILLVLVIVSQCLTIFQSYSWYKWVDITVNIALIIMLLRIMGNWFSDNKK